MTGVWLALGLPVLAGLVLLACYVLDKFTRVRGTMRLFHLFEPFGYTQAQMGNLEGKQFVVTGGNSGLGLATVKLLAQAGGNVVLACRNTTLGETAKRAIGTTKGTIVVMELDLADLKSVKRFSNAFKQLKLPLHSLVLNAGVMMCPFELTKDGIESQFGVNHVGHFALAKDLVDVLEQTKQSSVVSVSSVAHWFPVPGGVYLNLDDINDEAKYSPGTWYGQSKLANLLFAREFAKRYPKVLCNAVHPGGVQGNLNRHLVGGNSILSLVDLVAQGVFYWPGETAALTSVAAAVGVLETKTTGKYFVPIARLDDGSELSRNDQLASKVWEFTEQLLKSKSYDSFQ
ncbi:hypothetical protein BASA81_011016 [Batrachochytrium salamandrivorans]|nr:hypothetical protein BASA81_011016 [Batrachochytrium salamandrivorans]